MNAGLIARRYATVLYDFATEHKVAERVYNDTKLLLEVFTSKPSIMQFLNSPLRKPSEKLSMIKSTFENIVIEETMQFINFTIEKSRIGMIDEVLRVFQSIYKKRLGIKSVDITTAKDLTDKTEKNFTSIIENKLKSKVEMSFKTDESIIGGVIINIDGRQLDCSVQRQLKEIEKELTV